MEKLMLIATLLLVCAAGTIQSQIIPTNSTWDVMIDYDKPYSSKKLPFPRNHETYDEKWYVFEWGNLQTPACIIGRGITGQQCTTRLMDKMKWCQPSTIRRLGNAANTNPFTFNDGDSSLTINNFIPGVYCSIRNNSVIEWCNNVMSTSSKITKQSQTNETCMISFTQSLKGRIPNSRFTYEIRVNDRLVNIGTYFKDDPNVVKINLYGFDYCAINGVTCCDSSFTTTSINLELNDVVKVTAWYTPKGGAGDRVKVERVKICK